MSFANTTDFDTLDETIDEFHNTGPTGILVIRAGGFTNDRGTIVRADPTEFRICPAVFAPADFLFKDAQQDGNKYNGEHFLGVKGPIGTLRVGSVRDQLEPDLVRFEDDEVWQIVKRQSWSSATVQWYRVAHVDQEGT